MFASKSMFHVPTGPIPPHSAICCTPEYSLWALVETVELP